MYTINIVLNIIHFIYNVDIELLTDIYSKMTKIFMDIPTNLGSKHQNGVCPLTFMTS
jgi:hypothetical protein